MQVWRQACDGDALPKWGEVHFLDFPPRAIARMILLDVGTWTYRFWGSEVRTFGGGDYTGRGPKDLEIDDTMKAVIGQYEEIVAAAETACFVARIRQSEWGVAHVLVLRLPFAADGRTVDHVLSIAVYEERQGDFEPIWESCAPAHPDAARP